jgi:hemoglobin-like flavoprotein
VLLAMEEPETDMTPAQIALVRNSYMRIVLNLEQVADLFYQRLLELDPGIGSMFHGDRVTQRTKLGAALASMVGSLGQMDRILPVLRALGREQARKGICATHYTLIGEALVWALERAFRDDFTAESGRAWMAAFGVVAWAMIGTSEEDWSEAEAA